MNARGEKGLSLSLHVPFLLREAPVRMTKRRRGMIGCSTESSTPHAARKPPNGRASGVAEALRSRRNAASAGYGTAARGRERARLEPCEQAGECERREHASADDRLPALHSAERHALRRTRAHGRNDGGAVADGAHVAVGAGLGVGAAVGPALFVGSGSARISAVKRSRSTLPSMPSTRPRSLYCQPAQVGQISLLSGSRAPYCATQRL